jgi:Family of unknown function (DUF6266)
MCAVIKRGILGGFQNKIANVVGGSWKGISYMRSLPISVANPQTAAQTAQRTKFAQVVDFAVGILTTVVKPLWDRFAQYQSGYNAFVQANIDNFDDTGLITPADLIISKGTLATIGFLLKTVDDSASTLAVTWDPTPGGDANPTDTLYIAIWNANTGESEGFDTGVTRSVGSATVSITIGLTVGDVISIWSAARKADGTKVSDTSYTTQAVTA